jgi:hypothetical protein
MRASWRALLAEQSRHWVARPCRARHDAAVGDAGRGVVEEPARPQYRRALVCAGGQCSTDIKGREGGRPTLGALVAQSGAHHAQGVAPSGASSAQLGQQPGTMFQWTPDRAPSPPGGRPTARASVNGHPYGTEAASASPKKSSNSMRRAPRAVLGEQLATGPGQPPGRAWEGDDRAASTRRQRSRRWPGRPSRSQPTTLLSRESACQAVGHWLHHSLLQLHTTRPIEYPVRWFAVLGGRVAHCVGGGAGGQVTIAATPSVESMASLSLARVASLDAGQRTVTTRSRWC